MSNVRALAAGAITLSRPARAAHAAAVKPIVVARKHGSAPQLAWSVRLGPVLKRRARPGLLQPTCRLRAKCMALARLAQGRFPQSCRVACGPTGFALTFNSMQTHVYRSGTHPRFKSVEGRLGQAPSTAGGAELAASENERPNPSIEGTSTIRLRLIAAAPHVKR